MFDKLLFTLTMTLILMVTFEGISKIILNRLPQSNPFIDIEEHLQGMPMPYSSELLWSSSPEDTYEYNGIQYNNNTFGFRILPNSFDTTNSVLFIGDSSTYGFGVNSDESYAALFGKCSHRQTINAAVNGYSSTQSKHLLQSLYSNHKEVLESVDIVIIANLWSDMLPAKISDTERIYQIQQIEKNNKVLRSWLYNNSFTYHLLKDGLTPTRDPSIININDILSGKEYGDVKRVDTSEYKANLEAMITLVQKHSATPIILLHPTNTAGPHPSNDEQGPYRLAAKDVADNYNVQVIDLDEVFNDKLRTDFFLDVVHPSSFGHQHIAGTMCKQITLTH